MSDIHWRLRLNRALKVIWVSIKSKTTRKCRMCRGTGFDPLDPKNKRCPLCRGEGTREAQRRYRVN